MGPFASSTPLTTCWMICQANETEGSCCSAQSTQYTWLERRCPSSVLWICRVLCFKFCVLRVPCLSPMNSSLPVGDGGWGTDASGKNNSCKSRFQGLLAVRRYLYPQFPYLIEHSDLALRFGCDQTRYQTQFKQGSHTHMSRNTRPEHATGCDSITQERPNCRFAYAVSGLKVMITQSRMLLSINSWLRHHAYSIL